MGYWKLLSRDRKKSWRNPRTRDLFEINNGFRSNRRACRHKLGVKTHPANNTLRGDWSTKACPPTNKNSSSAKFMKNLFRLVLISLMGSESKLESWAI